MFHPIYQSLVAACAMHIVAFASVVLATEASPRTFELQDIITLALERNPILAGAEGAVQQSQGQRIEAGAYPNPSIAAQTGGGTIRDPSTGTSLNEYLFTLSQPLEWTGKRSSRQREAEAGLAGTSIGVEEARLNLIADVKMLFYDLLLAEQQAQIAIQNLSTVQKVARVVQARVMSGEGPQFEAVKADVEVMKANQVVTRASNAVRVRRVSLDTVTAGALGTNFAIRGDFHPFKEGMDLDGLTVRAIGQHPTINRLRKQVERAGFAVVKEQQSRVPDVTVFGGYAREVGREAVIGGISVPTPIWYQRQGHIAAALGTKRQEEAELVRAQNELVKVVNQHFQDAQTAEDQIEVFEKGLLKQAQEALRIAQLSFQHGASSLLEVLDAQRVGREIQVDYAQARFNLSLALTRLERSVGGSL